MSAGIFPFLLPVLRWAARWRALVGDVAAARPVLAVGDLHRGELRPWRDAEGGLCGGERFDEAWPLRTPNDLVRLGTQCAARREYHAENHGKEAVRLRFSSTGTGL